MAGVTRTAGAAGAGGAPARRVALPSWRDPRLVVGVLLVLAAVVAGARVVAAADRTVPVYAAAEALTPGERVGPDQLEVVRLRLDGGGGAAAYVSASRPPDGELVALRGVGAGELVPAAALGEPGALDVRPVGVPVEGALPADLVPGALVDVWVTAVDPASPGALLEPRRVVAAAPVAEVDADSGALGSAATTTVQVIVGTDQLPDVLAALAADAEVQLVLSPGGGGDVDPVAARAPAAGATGAVTASPSAAPAATAPAPRPTADGPIADGPTADGATADGATADGATAAPTAAAPRAPRAAPSEAPSAAPTRGAADRTAAPAPDVEAPAGEAPVGEDPAGAVSAGGGTGG